MKRVPLKLHVNLFRVLKAIDILTLWLMSTLRSSCLMFINARREMSAKLYTFWVFFSLFSFPEATIPLLKYYENYKSGEILSLDETLTLTR